MKKRMIALMLCISMCALALTGCGKDEKESTSASTSKENEVDYLAYVELGDYKNLKLTKTVTPVTDAEVEEAIVAAYSSTNIEEGACQEGDTVYIAYEGKLDGVAFEGGTTDGTSITLGNSGYIDGFDDGVIGMEIGETKDLDLTFPDPYLNNEELSGKAVVFTVTLQSITRSFSELTEDWLKTYTEYDNIEDYRASVRKDLEEQAALADDTEFENLVWTDYIATCTVSEYIQSELDSAKEMLEEYFTQYAQMFGTDLAGYIELCGMTEEEYQEQLQAAAEENAKSNMVLGALVQTEGLTTEDEEYKELMVEATEEYGLGEEELLETYGEDQIYRYIMSRRVMNIMLENATITEETAADTTEDTTTSGVE